MVEESAARTGDSGIGFGLIRGGGTENIAQPRSRRSFFDPRRRGRRSFWSPSGKSRDILLARVHPAHGALEYGPQIPHTAHPAYPAPHSIVLLRLDRRLEWCWGTGSRGGSKWARRRSRVTEEECDLRAAREEASPVFCLADQGEGEGHGAEIWPGSVEVDESVGGEVQPAVVARWILFLAAEIRRG